MDVPRFEISPLGLTFHSLDWAFRMQPLPELPETHLTPGRQQLRRSIAGSGDLSKRRLGQ
jgi:hypothetical protein